MEVVQLDRFELEGVLGSGSDYQAHAATDGCTGKQVVLKRPNPHYVSRKLHHGVDRLSERLIELHRAVGDSLPRMAHLIGYTEISQHDGYFGDSLKESYRVLVTERAKGIPLVSDIADRFRGVPVGLGQNLFALHPLAPHRDRGYFSVHQQLMDLEEAFLAAGHLLLDMRPQNIYFDLQEGGITVIDIGTTPTQGSAAQGRASMGTRPKDIHDFFPELFKFYVSPDSPPMDAAKYGEPTGMRTIPRFDQELEFLIRGFSALQHRGLKEVAVDTLKKVQRRAYTSFGEFRRDFTQLLSLLEERNKSRPDLDALIDVWGQAARMLSGHYWKKFLFDPDSDLAGYSVT